MPTEPVGHQHLGRYTLLRPLAQGGMAELFLARQWGPAGFEKSIVIKRVLPHLSGDERFVQMFLDEARLAARLTHPNIVSVNDFGEADGSYFLCMEQLDGCDLDGVLRLLQRRQGFLPATLAALIASAVCDGLHYAHTLEDEHGQPLGIVHRDISPSNIFITYQGAVKILDFGIAKAAARIARTEADLLKGKLLYMSPEQIEGRPLDARSDVFSLGLVLYLILTGTHPFPRENPVAVARAICEEDVPDPTSHRGDLPPRLCAIVLGALERVPTRRYPSAQALREDLDGFLASCSTLPPAARLQGLMRDLMKEAAERVHRARPEPSAPPDQHVTSPNSLSTRVEPRRRIPTRRGSARRFSPWISLLLTIAAILVLGAGALTVLPPSAPPVQPDPDATGRVPSMEPAQNRRIGLPPLDLAVEPAAGMSPPPRGPAASRPEAPPSDAVPGAHPPEPPPAITQARPSTRGLAKRRRPGLLSVSCVPWCNIQVDGSDVGRPSPLIDHELPAGHHQLRVANPVSKVERTQELEIQPGRSTLVKVHLDEDTAILVHTQEAP